MLDQPFTDSDPMGSGTTTTEVAPGSTDDRGGTQPTEGATNAPTFSPDDFVKGLDLDPADPKKSFDEKFVPKAVFTQKTQALAEDRKKFEAERAAIFELVRNGINRPQAPQGPTPEETRINELRDLAAAGDSKALQELVDLQAEQKVAPVREQFALKSAVDEARTFPEVANNWDAIMGAIQQNPVLNELAKLGNYKYAPKVMLALGYEAELRKAVPMIQSQQKEIADLKAKLASYEKERVVGLPPSTSRAGTSAGRPSAGEPKDVYDAALASWVELGGRPEDFR